MKKIIIITSIISVLLVIIVINPNHCNMSDKDAVLASKQFLIKTGMPYKAEPCVVNYDNNVNKTWLLSILFWLDPSDKDGKHLVVKGAGNEQYYITVNCGQEITKYRNPGLRTEILRKYSISTDNRKPRKWPPLLSEYKAKEIAVSYANKIGLSKEVIFSRMWLDLDHDGTWTAFWNRTFNGYPYEDDSLRIEIMAIEGEFYLYGKRFLGKPCPTEVKVTKEEAIAKGWKKIAKYFDTGKWGKLKNEYEVKSAELKIVQPNTFLGFVVPWKSKNSRLAWVIKFAPKIPPDDKKRIEIGYHDRFVIKIDAATKSFLGGETGMFK